MRRSRRRVHRRSRLAALGLLGLALVAPPASPASQPAAPVEQTSRTALDRANEAFERGDHAGAAELFRAAQAEGVNRAFLHFRLGYSLHVLGRIEEALPHHLRGSRISQPAIRIDCLYNAACAHALLGHADDAIRFLQHAIDAGFEDTDQVGHDSDLDSIRQDPRFVDLVAGIGTVPTLFHQLDFLLGDWEMAVPDGRTVPFSYSRPAAGSSAILYQSTHPQGLSWVGMLIPDAPTRTWTWTYCDDRGTRLDLTGRAGRDSVTFQGWQSDAGGRSPELRITLSLEPDGRVRERSEYTHDGRTWILHHEEHLVRTAPSAP